MSKEELYVDVILPIPQLGSFTYSLNNISDEVQIGNRVVVQFGARRIYTAVVVNVHSIKPNYVTKNVLEIYDDNLITPIQIQFWKWISDYYASSLGDVSNMALPSFLKLASETILIIDPEFDGDVDGLSSCELKILNFLIKKNECKVSDVVKSVKINRVLYNINNLIRKEILLTSQDLNEKFKHKYIQTVKLINSNIDELINLTKRAKKQNEFIRLFVDLSKSFPEKKWTITELVNEYKINRRIILELSKKGLIKIENKIISRLFESIEKVSSLKSLSKSQEIAYKEIVNSFNKSNITLLHGVTSSGKTEIYIKLIKSQIESGKQSLYLLPEIALTSQIINRLKIYFGSEVGVFHSGLSNSEKFEVWKAVKGNGDEINKYKVILGVRSSIFLPFNDLGLIIIDEEHDDSFKERSRNPRYNARDAAIYLAKLHNSKVLLGSATPSIETYYKSKSSKFSLVNLDKRYGNIAMPKIKIIDLRKSYSYSSMKFHFSEELVEKIKDTLTNKKQVIIFQNRRGYSPILECDSCSWSYTCKHCDVSLTYHKESNLLKCHYCGYNEKKSSNNCTQCSNGVLIDKGFGTEQIQDELFHLFPEANVQRMDYDTTRKKNSYDKIINQFEHGYTDILVGTQMVTKGLDFDNVALVAILNADSMLKYPDFRSYERAFQLMSQVAGRAGRKNERGEVIIQTFDPYNTIFDYVVNNDFHNFYKSQLIERSSFNYPPYCRLLKINLQHKNIDVLNDVANKLSKSLRISFSQRVLGPEFPPISKVKNFYNKDFLIKIELGSSYSNAKSIISSILKLIQKKSNFSSLRVNIIVDY